MTPERREQIEALFDEALDLPEDQREAFLQESCGEDQELYDAVMRLLDAYQHAPSFLDESAATVGSEMMKDDEDAEASRTDDRVGPYRVLEQLGRGGMSVVYLAERVDGEFEQTAALKLLPAHFETEERVSRFRAERQILASLAHPNIARLLDGGMTDGGHPYLAMEYVDGLPITAYANEQELGLSERLSLLCDVLHALQFAHKNLIVHRDIKPSNILVDEHGQVKLLDFGIAKLLDQQELPFTLPETRTGQRLMTPEYAAPEQVRGENITTATDVYQAGVLAYELLTGRRPFDLHDKTPSQIEQIVAEQEPERPSTAISADTGAQTKSTDTALAAGLTSELDAIILKALSKEPDRRYTSVEAFAEDIERFLEGRPVKARTPTLGYRARKFATRHRWQVATAAAVALLVIGFLVALISQRNIALEERDRYQQELATSEAVTEYLTELFAASNPRETQGDTLTAFELLDLGAASIDQLDAQSRVQTRLMEVMAASYEQIGDLEEADELLGRALDLTRKETGERSAATASVLAHLASLRNEQGDADAADSLYREALAIKRDELSPDHPDLSRSINGLATILSRAGEFEEAETLYREALELRREAHGEEHEHVAATMRNLGILLGRQDRLDEAAELMEEALEIERQVLGPSHLQVSETATSLAVAYSQQGDSEAARPLLEEALEIKTQTLGEEHPSLLATINNLGVITERLGDYTTADSLYGRTLDLAEATYGRYHPSVGMTTSNRGTLARRQGDYETALERYREALEIQDTVYDSQHPEIAGQLKNIAHALDGLERYDEAESYFLEALDHAETVYGADSPRMEEFLRDTAAFYESQGDQETANQYLERLEG